MLGVAPDADWAAVRRAYHRLARLHHPDVGGSTARMRELNRAYALLTERRRARSTGPRVADMPTGGSTGARERAPAHRDRPVRDLVPPWELLAVRLRAWCTSTWVGQWMVSLSMVVVIQEVARMAGAATPSLVEVVALGLALRLQAGATPTGRVFAPVRDVVRGGVVLLRALRWFASCR